MMTKLVEKISVCLKISVTEIDQPMTKKQIRHCSVVDSSR